MKKEKIWYKGFGLCLVTLLLLVIAPASSESEDSGHASKTQTSGEGYAVGATSLVQVKLNEMFKLRPSETAEVTDYEDLRITLGEIGWTGYPCEPGAPCIEIAVQYVDIKVYDPSKDEAVKAQLYTIKNNKYAPNSIEVAGVIVKLLEIGQDAESAKFVVYSGDCIGEGEKGSIMDGDVCCGILQKVSNSYPSDGLCVAVTDGSFICTNCGDGGCGLAENKCNCPEDCAESINLRVDARTDRAVYEYGETVKIIAEVYDGRGVGNAEVTAEIYGPCEAVQFQLTSNVCSSSACVCPTNQRSCDCNPTVSCKFEGGYTPSDEGSYSVTVRAEYSGETAYDKTEFTVEEETEYKRVRLDEKFNLQPPDTAVVVDYGDMQVKLVYISVPACGPSNTSCVGDPVATVQVSMPYVVEAKGSTEMPIAGVGSGTAMQFPMREGESKSVFGATLSLLDLTYTKGTFVVSKKNGDYLDVKVTPGSQRVNLGDTVKYEITVRDKHPAYKTYPASYTYNIGVVGLPFGLAYDDQVTLTAGETKNFILVVDTSKRQINVVAEEASTAKTYDMADTGVVTAKPLAERIALTETKTAVQAGNVEAVPEAVPSESTQYMGPSYRFRVVVTQADDSGVRDVAYAILYVIPGSPPKPPSERIRISLKNGWNLITLPGKGTLEGGSCSGEPYAFVYIKEYEKYYSLREARGLLGEEGLLEYLRLHSFWVYSFEDCALSFNLEESTSFNEVSLGSNWNFVPITSDMLGRKISEFSGDCELKKLYGWGADGQNWEKWDEDTTLSDSDIYKGFVARVESSCDLGWGAIITPPPLPEG